MDVKNESKVLVIYTGGTIGMVRNSQGVLAPQVQNFSEVTGTVPVHYLFSSEKCNF
jgi:L-asparaginase/Glu-tRNA(Gln) amidotransferase subunit D